MSDLSDAELIRQMAAYIAGMESAYEADEDDDESDGDDEVEHWKREAEDAEARFQVERQAVETLRAQLQERVRMGRDDPANASAGLDGGRVTYCDSTAR